MRLEILRMAKDMLDQQYTTAATYAWEMYEKAAKENAELYKTWEEFIPKMYTPDEIIAQAEKLKAFINKSE